MYMKKQTNRKKLKNKQVLIKQKKKSRKNTRRQTEKMPVKNDATREKVLVVDNGKIVDYSRWNIVKEGRVSGSAATGGAETRSQAGCRQGARQPALLIRLNFVDKKNLVTDEHKIYNHWLGKFKWSKSIHLRVMHCPNVKYPPPHVKYPPPM